MPSNNKNALDTAHRCTPQPFISTPASSHRLSRGDGGKLNPQRVQWEGLSFPQGGRGRGGKSTGEDALVLLDLHSQEHNCHLDNSATCTLSCIFTSTTVQQRSQQLRRTLNFLLHLPITLAYQSLRVETTNVYGAT